MAPDLLLRLSACKPKRALTGVAISENKGAKREFAPD
jgi:hypothetical protein